jgi:DNA mismatch repair protein MutL
MSEIKILPARLANQIAAGEVVERPASVVKELVENSIDAGATRIDIDIEKGGSKLIRIRDNGKGIVKDELQLALSRHATSKITTLDDLEAIMSLGFRGEALASISSVSRLTLTSRTATQEQAWSAYSEGRDMQVKLQPAAHPVGCTVEVLDLFFNTPARRKFLRTDKTEFTHIEELVKRIALSRLDVTLQLRHNGKLVKQYRAAKTESQIERRLQSVCGNNFAQNMLRVELEHQDLKLHGWITTPDGARAQGDLQYCYVNGRMMRDKLINHAIRQSYELTLRPDQFAAYVLFIEIDAHQVDVNVHPAKHEVRFHQSRLVHDFIYQALADALSQSSGVMQVEQKRQSAFATSGTSSIQANVDTSSDLTHFENTAHIRSEREAAAMQQIPNYPNKGETYSESLKENRTIQSASNIAEKPVSAGRDNWGSKKANYPVKKEAVSVAETRLYQQLLSTPFEQKPVTQTAVTQTAREQKPITQIGKALAVVDEKFLLVNTDAGCALLSLTMAELLKLKGQLSVEERILVKQPLLIPLALKVSSQDIELLKRAQPMLERFAIQLMFKANSKVMVMAVSQSLRQHNLQQLFTELITLLNQKQEITVHELSLWLAIQVANPNKSYTLSEAVQLLGELEAVYAQGLDLNDHRLIQRVDFSTQIKAFSNE